MTISALRETSKDSQRWRRHQVWPHCTNNTKIKEDVKVSCCEWKRLLLPFFSLC